MTSGGEGTLDVGDYDVEFSIEDSAVPTKGQIGGKNTNLDVLTADITSSSASSSASSSSSSIDLLSFYKQHAASKLNLKEITADDWTITNIYKHIQYAYTDIGVT